MKRLALMLAAACCVFMAAMQVRAAQPEERQEIEVLARGMGSTPDEALKDALSQAVLQAAGAVVDSETLVKNDEIIQEKILTASNAIVKKYDVVAPARQKGNGLFEVKIRALVQQNLLRRKLVEQKIIAGKVEGAQDLWAEIVTQEKNRGDMLEMLKAALGKIDFKNYMSFDILGKNGKRGSEAELLVKAENDNRVSVYFGLVCMFDDRRFQKEVMPQLRRIFDALPFESTGKFICQDEYTLEYELKMDSNPNMAHNPNDKRIKYRVLCTDNFRGRDFIALNVSPRFRPNLQKFVLYRFPKSFDKNSFSKCFDQLERKIDPVVSLLLINAEGEEVHRIATRIKNSGHLGNYGRIGLGLNYDGDGLIVSPMFFFRCSHYAASPLYIIRVHGTMALEDYKEVKSFKLEVSWD